MINEQMLYLSRGLSDHSLQALQYFVDLTRNDHAESLRFFLIKSNILDILPHFMHDKNNSDIQHEQPFSPDQPSPSIGVSDELIHLSSEFSFIASFLQHRSPEIVDVCVCCLYRLAQKNILALSHLLENNTAVHLLNLLPSLSGETTSFLIIRLLGSYLSLSQKHAQELIDINIVPVIAQLLVTTTSDDTRFGIAWIAANIALGPPSQINHLFRTGIPTSFILRSAYLNDRIIREVSFLFVGLVDNAPDKMGELVKVGLVQCLLDMVMRKDCDLVRNAMDCLVKLIRILPDERGGVLREIVEGPGMRSIAQSQNHSDQKIQHLASSIIAFTEEELG
ncbi:hypothetical protein BLNAU_2308 [Blattamonas nauphoetae]|uniref:Uncharacterized protein n=1 Tax=Blattamonas nauphoetae TaxID=2049346 RepID=A0ABQ9YGN0_9EUKA|nr:hypothetical protein BLNAU_2308 [Blattamonas nauphoetae]